MQSERVADLLAGRTPDRLPWVPELNAGQLALLLRARFLVDVIPMSKVKGRPFEIAEVEARSEEVLS